MWSYRVDASVYGYLRGGGDALSPFDHLLKRSTLSIIYQQFNSAIFTETDVKNAICRSYSISPKDIEKHLRYLLRRNYIKTVDVKIPIVHYQFSVPEEEWTVGGEIH